MYDRTGIDMKKDIKIMYGWVELRCYVVLLVGIQKRRFGRTDIHANKFSQQPRRTALEQDVVKESFQQEHLQAEISSIEATEPTLALL